MKEPGTKNVGASVRQRLLNKARETRRPFSEILQYFAMERFLYRLSKSEYADKFVRVIVQCCGSGGHESGGFPGLIVS